MLWDARKDENGGQDVERTHSKVCDRTQEPRSIQPDKYDANIIVQAAPVHSAPKGKQLRNGATQQASISLVSHFARVYIGLYTESVIPRIRKRILRNSNHFQIM